MTSKKLIATKKYLENRGGYKFLKTDEENSIFVVKDIKADEIVIVIPRICTDKFDEDARLTRNERSLAEEAMFKYMTEAPKADINIRIDSVDIVLVASNKAIIRHAVNVGYRG